MKVKLGILLLAIFLVLQGGVALADESNLVIDNSPINQTSSGNSDASIGYQVAPYLFLNDTQSAQKKLETGSEAILAEGKGQSFSKSIVKAKTLNLSPINQQLFSKSYTSVVETGSGHLNSSTPPLPKGLVYLFVGGILVFAGVIGVLLGQRFSKLFVKREKNKN